MLFDRPSKTRVIGFVLLMKKKTLQTKNKKDGEIITKNKEKQYKKKWRVQKRKGDI